MLDRQTADGGASSLAAAVAAAYGGVPQVAAVALAGSRAGPSADAASDLDLYVYVDADLPLDARAAIMRRFASAGELDNRFFEPGDEWIAAGTGIAVDVIYRPRHWIETALERVLERHEAALGYTTCLWHNVLASTALHDRDGWFGRLQAWATRPYPDALRHAIVAKNHPMLRRAQSSYWHQLELAVRRRDPVSVHHRLTAILASYFDILFAVNGRPHPGEKRLIERAEALCPKRPPQMARQLVAVLRVPATAERGALLGPLDELLDALDALLAAEGLAERGPAPRARGGG